MVILLKIKMRDLLASGAFEHLNCQHTEFDQIFSKKSNARGFAPGGYCWEFLMGMCCPVLQILTLFQTTKCHFSQPFSDLDSKKNVITT